VEQADAELDWLNKNEAHIRRLLKFVNSYWELKAGEKTESPSVGVTDPQPVETPRLGDSQPGVVHATSIVDYFLHFEREQWCESSPANLLAYVSGRSDQEHKSFVDVKNGYIFLNGQGAQVTLAIALLKGIHGSPDVTAVSWGDYDTDNDTTFTRLNFYTLRNGVMREYHPTFIGGCDAESLKVRCRFVLPQFGVDLKVVSADNGQVCFVWHWNGQAFVFTGDYVH
jgi:hypothetical protein